MSLQSLTATLARPVTQPPGRKRPLRALATAISLTATAEAQIVIVYAAMAQTFGLLFERDRAGWVNLDPVDGRVLVPVAWGRGGHQLYGLTRLERDTLRSLLADLRATPVRYEPSRRCWHVRLERCPDLATALAWLDSRPISAEMWRGRMREISGRLAARRG